MAEDTTHSIVTLGLLLNAVKRTIAALRQREEKATEPEEKDRLRRERQTFENKEEAILKEMKELRAERRGSPT